MNGSPAERVHQEESQKEDRLNGVKATFGAQLMTHNIQVNAILVFVALGLTWGFGTILELFYNGVILGAVCADYIAGGQGTFLAGWLLPHGVVEIPSILLGGQAGFILANALIGWGGRTRVPSVSRRRARSVCHLLPARRACWFGQAPWKASSRNTTSRPFPIR